jgi:hypothetical protein
MQPSQPVLEFPRVSVIWPHRIALDELAQVWIQLSRKLREHVGANFGDVIGFPTAMAAR